MLGNDVVDLRDPDSEPGSFRPRFEARVFTPGERRAISRDRDPLARRWAHWAAKEAAFKLARQLDAQFIFAPSRFAVHFDSSSPDATRRVERRGTVEGFDDIGLTIPSVEVRSFETEDWVHVVATPVGADWGAVDLFVEPLTDMGVDPVTAVRDLAIRGASRSLGIEPHRLTIGTRDEARSGWQGGPPRAAFGAPGRRRIPTIELDGVPTSLSLSLSDHGRFIGYAMTPRIETSLQGRRRQDSRSTSVSRGAMTL